MLCSGRGGQAVQLQLGGGRRGKAERRKLLVVHVSVDAGRAIGEPLRSVSAVPIWCALGTVKAASRIVEPVIIVGVQPVVIVVMSFI